MVCILVFVNQNVMEPVLPTLTNGFYRQQFCGDKKQIIEIQGVVFFHVLVIEIIHISHFLGKEIAPCVGTEFFRSDELVLRIGNMILHGIGLEGFIIQIELFEHILYQRFGIVGIINGESVCVWRIAFDFSSEEPSPKGMEGVHPNFLSLGPHQVADTFPHFLGRFIGKGNGQDFSWVNALFQHVSNAASQCFGLARPRTGHNQNRPFGGHHRFLLPGIQGI